jgi:hypothetical protein
VTFFLWHSLLLLLVHLRLWAMWEDCKNLQWTLTLLCVVYQSIRRIHRIYHCLNSVQKTTKNNFEKQVNKKIIQLILLPIDIYLVVTLTNYCLTDNDILKKVKDEVKFAQYNGNIFAIVYIGELRVLHFIYNDLDKLMKCWLV